MLIKEYLSKVVQDVLLKRDIVIDVSVERTQNVSFGHYATPIAFSLTRILKKSPLEIAKGIIEEIEDPLGYISRIDVKNGFINFTLKPIAFHSVLRNILRERENYGRTKEGVGKKIQIEFISANPSGPIHVGNGRGGALGDVLANLFEWFGYDVEREFYINDMGTQMGLLALSVEARMKELMGEPFQIPEEGYHGEYVKDIARLAIERFGDGIWVLSQEERLEKLKEFAETLLKKPLYIPQDGGFLVCNWFAGLKYESKRGVLLCSFHPDLKP
ncbi:MAG: arginine--tRNA ligase, partial [bacterium]